MRDPQIVEEELVEIGAIPDDATKLERLIAWAASHPDELVFAIRLFSGRSDGIGEWARRHASIVRETHGH